MWHEQAVEARGSRFHVRTLGSGDAVMLLLHGWPQDGSVWESIAPRLAAAGFRVVCPDLKGFGRSDAPRGGYDPATLASEIGALIEALGVDDAVVVGHDWGGIVALHTVRREPRRVRRAVVMSAPHRRIDLRRAWHIPLFNVPVVPEVVFGSPARARRLVRIALHHAAARTTSVSDGALDRYTAAVAADPRGWLSYYRGMSRRAVGQSLRRLLRRDGPSDRRPVTVPLTLVWGAEDPVTPAALAERDAHDLGAQFVTIPGVGHFLPDEAPDELAEVLLDLVASDRRGPATAEPRRG